MDEGVNIGELLLFLDDWKSNRQIKERFCLSQNEFYHLSRWLKLSGHIDCVSGLEADTDNILVVEDKRLYFYKAKKNN